MNAEAQPKTKLAGEVEEISSVKTVAEEGAKTESSAGMPPGLSPIKKGLWERMTTGAKKIAKGIYEKAYEEVRYKLPGDIALDANRIASIITVDHNQVWADRHEKKAVQQKEKIDSFDMEIGALDKAKSRIEAAAENLRAKGLPGAESLQLEVKVIEAKQAELADKKDKARSKLEARENKVALYTNKRDQIAGRLAERYEEKAKPLEKELGRLQNLRLQVDFEVAGAEIVHKEQLAELAGIEKDKTEIEEAYRAAGKSEREIRNGVKALEKLITDGKEKIRIEKENLEKRRAVIDKKIAKVDASANVYRDGREKFTRVTKKRPIEMNLPERERCQAFDGREETKANPRANARRETSGAERSTVAPEVAIEQEEDKRLNISEFIDLWNAKKKEYNASLVLPTIKPEDFLEKLSTVSFPRDQKLELVDFKRLLKTYYRIKNVRENQFDAGFDAFEAGIRAEPAENV